MKTSLKALKFEPDLGKQVRLNDPERVGLSRKVQTLTRYANESPSFDDRCVCRLTMLSLDQPVMGSRLTVSICRWRAVLWVSGASVISSAASIVGKLTTKRVNIGLGAGNALMAVLRIVYKTQTAKISFVAH